MPDKWAQYAVPATPKPDPWAQYAQPAQSSVAGADGPLPGVPKAPVPAGLQGPPPSSGVKALHAAESGAVGVAKGAAHTFLNIADTGQALRQSVENHTPDWLNGKGFSQEMGEPTADQNRAALKPMLDSTQPDGTAQKLGYGGEQIAEFLAPSGIEKSVVSGITSIPKLAKAAPLVRPAVASLFSGMVNKAQGGSFTGGAAAGGVGGAIGEGFRAAAPFIAESAGGIRAADRAYGKSGGAIGRVILSDTKGINPANISKQASDKIADYGNQLEASAQNAPPISLYGGRQVAQDAQATAALRNNPETIKRTGSLYGQLTQEASSGAPIPQQVSAARGLQLKRGIGDLKNSWNPAVQNDFADTATGHVYKALDNELDAAIPNSQGMNEKMSLLTPVKDRFGATALNASAGQRILGRMTRPTGALFGAGAGATAGYQAGGVPGAMVGGVAGLAAPEVIGSPRFQMYLARRAANGATPVVRALIGGGAQTQRKSLYGN